MATSLLQLLGGDLVAKDVVISGLTNDSRRVGPGDLFAALPGSNIDGRKFIPDAIRQGAAAILTTDIAEIEPCDIPVVTDSNPRRRYAELAARFCGPQPSFQVAVTGTNGKTSVADFTRQIWSHTGVQAASVGTLGVRSQLSSTSGGLTTPDPMELHTALANLKKTGVNNIAVEASSHGLDQYRLDGMQFKAAAFTNLTRDHLDYHKTEQAYFYAKARLFGELLAPGATAVINTDDQWGAILDDIAWGRSLNRITFGRDEKAVLRLLGAAPNSRGQQIRIAYDGNEYETELTLIGEFQASNTLAAAGLVLSGDADLSDILAAFPKLVGVPGRLELIGSLNGASIFVDYAHTPDGLRTVLNAVRAHQPARLHVIFGCGGDRDRGKRPQMGHIASELADAVYVTDDNPRSENPGKIRQEILDACPGALEFADRSDAIEAAANAANPGDMIIVAGKGHETGQTFADGTIEYSDIEVVRALTGAVPSTAQGKV